MFKNIAVSMLLLFAVYAALPSAEQPSERDCYNEAIAFAREGKFKEAISSAQQSLQVHPNSVHLCFLLGRLFESDGNDDQMLQTWEQGLKHADKDQLQLLWGLANKYGKLSEDGPNVKHEDGFVVYSPADPSVDEDKWKQERYEKAIGFFKRGIAADEEKKIDWILKALHLHEIHDKVAEGLSLAQEALKEYPEHKRILKYAATFHLENGNHKQAQQLFKAVLAKKPRAVYALEGLAELYRMQGDQAAAQECTQRAYVFQHLVAGTSLEYAPSLYDTLRILVEREETAVTVLNDLKLKNDELSYELMLAACYAHGYHGAVEDSLYKKIITEDKQAEQRLMRLLDNAQSECTAKNCMRGLAELKSPAAFKILINYLPRDVRPFWHLDVAGSLAVLGDERAVPGLIKIARPHDDKALPAMKGPKAMDGRPLARIRALLALGSFDTAESRAALQAACAIEELACTAHAALFQLDRQEKHAQFVISNEQAPHRSMMLRKLVQLGHAQSKLLVEQEDKADK